MKRQLQCAEQQDSSSNFTKYCACHANWISWLISHMKRHLQCAEQQESQSNFTKYCACHPNWISWLILVTYETSFTMCGATGITIQLHQILPLPRKMNPMIHPHQIWKVIYNARSNQSHPATAANTAPATQSHSHDNSSSHMKRHLQCAEQHWFPSNITKYCACHEILSSRCQRKIPELLPPIERRFEDNPTMIRAWNRHLAPAASETLLFASCRRILYGKIQHFALRLSPKISGNPAPATKSDAPPSPNTAPATQNESHDWSASDMKRHLQWAEQPESPSNCSKYCACHAKWISWLIRVTFETSFRMRGASNVNLQPQQTLRLPRKMNLMIDARLIWNVISNAQSKQCQPPTSANTAPATKSLSSRLQRKLSELLPPI